MGNHSIRVGCWTINFYVEDQYFIYGLQACISEIEKEKSLSNQLLEENSQPKVDNSRELNILKLIRGEEKICNAKICNRLNSINILVVDEVQALAPSKPGCFREALLLSSRASVRMAKDYISRVLLKPINKRVVSYNCNTCKCTRLTEKQIKLIKYFLGGLTIRQISRLMKLSHKTCYSHKDNALAKLGVRSDHDLIELYRKKGGDLFT